MSSISDWVNNPSQEKNNITTSGGYYHANINTSGTQSYADPRWFNADKSSQQRIRRKKFVKNGWKSPADSADNYNPYILHFKFKKEVRINRIAFALLDHSQKWSISYYDAHRNKMLPVKFSVGNKKSDLRGLIRGNSGNWKSFNYDISKIRTNIIEVKLERNARASSFDPAPPAKYSLGLRDLSFKFISDGTEGKVGDDVFPGPTGYDEIVAYTHYDAYSAMDLSNYATQGQGARALYMDDIGAETFDIETGILDEETIVPNTNTYWVSAPQGAAESVVSLYVDIRDENLEASTFNMIRLLPIQPGPKMSVYYSNDDTVTSFAVSKNKFNIQSSASGSPEPTPRVRVKDSGYYVDDTYHYYFDNGKMNLDLLSDFVIGMEFKVTDNEESTNERCLWNLVDSTGDIGLCLTFIPSTFDSGVSMTGSFYIRPWQDSYNPAAPPTPLVPSGTTFTLEYAKTYGIVVGFNHQGSTNLNNGSAGWNIDVSEMTGSISDIEKYRFDVGEESSMSVVRGTNATAADVQTIIESIPALTSNIDGVVGNTDAGPYDVTFVSKFNPSGKLVVTSPTGDLTGAVSTLQTFVAEIPEVHTLSFDNGGTWTDGDSTRFSYDGNQSTNDAAGILTFTELNAGATEADREALIKSHIEAVEFGALVGNIEEVREIVENLEYEVEFVSGFSPLGVVTMTSPAGGFTPRDDGLYEDGSYISTTYLAETKETQRITLTNWSGTESFKITYDDVAAPNTTLPDKFIFGNNFDDSSPSFSYIRKLWIKQDTYVEATSNTFFADADSFINGELDQPTNRRSAMYNAVAIGDFITNGTAMLGPGGGFYSNKEWIPIPKDFVLINTDFDLNQTYTAKYIKLEFTGLMPRWYHSTRPLPIRGFPLYVRQIFDNLYEEQHSYYKGNVPINVFEEPNNNLSPLAVHGFNDINSAMKKADPNNFIFQQTLANYDSTKRLPTDVISLRKELSRASLHTRFPIAGRHTYETKYVPAFNKKAYFVGIKDLRIFRTTQLQTLDDPELYDFMDDRAQLDVNNSDINEFEDNRNCFFSLKSGASYPTERDAILQTQTFPSYSRFRTLQIATIEGPWHSPMGDDIINLDTLDFLLPNNVVTGDTGDANSYGAYPFRIVTDSYQGQSGGEVVLLDRYGIESAEYGAYTKPLVMKNSNGDTVPVYPGNWANNDSFPFIHAQTSAAVRMYLPGTSGGKYELRIWESDDDETIDTITLFGGPDQGTWTISYGGQTTTALATNATAQQVEDALLALSTIDDGQVSVTRSGSGLPDDPYIYEVTYPGPRLTVQNNGLYRNADTITIVTFPQGVAEIQTVKFGIADGVTLADPTGGTFTLSIEGGPAGAGTHTSGDIAYNADDAAVQAALNSITENNYGIVTKPGGLTGNYSILWSGEAEELTSTSSLTYSFTIDNEETTPGQNAANEVADVTLVGFDTSNADEVVDVTLNNFDVDAEDEVQTITLTAGTGGLAGTDEEQVLTLTAGDGRIAGTNEKQSLVMSGGNGAIAGTNEKQTFTLTGGVGQTDGNNEQQVIELTAGTGGAAGTNEVQTLVLTAGSPAGGTNELQILGFTAGSGGTGRNEIQQLNFGHNLGPGDKFKLKFNYHTTAFINYSKNMSDDITAALVALTDFASGDIIVTKENLYTYLVEFTGAWGYTNLNNTNEKLAITSTTGFTQDPTTIYQNGVNGAAGDTFKLTYRNAGGSVIAHTPVMDIPYGGDYTDITLSQIKRALKDTSFVNAVHASTGYWITVGQTLRVTGATGGPFNLEFISTLGNQNITEYFTVTEYGGTQGYVNKNGVGDSEQGVAGTAAATFKLKFNTQPTAAISMDGGYTEMTADTLIAAVNDADITYSGTTLVASDSDVGGNLKISGDYTGFDFEFVGELGEQDITSSWSMTNKTGTPNAANGTWSTVEGTEAEASDSFKLTYNAVESTSAVTIPEAGYTAVTAAQIESALWTIPAFDGSNISVTGAAGTYTVEFIGEYELQNISPKILLSSLSGVTGNTYDDGTNGSVVGVAPYAGDTFKLTCNLQSTGNIAFPVDGDYTDLTAANLVTALTGVNFGLGLIINANYTVTGPTGGPFVFEFDKSLGDLSDFTMTAKTGSADGSFGETVKGVAPVAADTFTLRFAGIDTPTITIPSGGYANLTLGAIQTAVGDNTFNTDSGLDHDVVVTGPTGGPFILEFTGGHGEQNIATIFSMTNKTGAANGTIYDDGSNGSVVGIDAISGDTFTLTYDGNVTPAIEIPVGDYTDVTLQQIFDALDDAAFAAASGIRVTTNPNLTVSGSTGGPFTLAFSNDLGQQDVPNFTVTNKTGNADGNISSDGVTGAVTTPQAFTPEVVEVQTMDLSNAVPGDEAQNGDTYKIALGAGGTNKTALLTYTDAAGGDTHAAEIQAAIRLVAGYEAATCVKVDANTFTITMVGVANPDQAQVTDTTGFTPDTPDATGFTTNTPYAAEIPETQRITLTDWNGTEYFKITYDGVESSTSVVRGTNGTAANVQTVIETIAALSSNIDSVSGTTNAGPYDVTFVAGFNPTGELSVTSTGGSTKGALPSGADSFTLTFDGNVSDVVYIVGTDYQDVTVNQISNAIESITGLTVGDNVTVDGTTGANPFTITFTGNLGGQDVGAIVFTPVDGAPTATIDEINAGVAGDSFKVEYPAGSGKKSISLVRGVNYTDLDIKNAIEAITDWPVGGTVSISNRTDGGFTITAGGTIAATNISDFDILDEVGCTGSAAVSTPGATGDSFRIEYPAGSGKKSSIITRDVNYTDLDLKNAIEAITDWPVGGTVSISNRTDNGFTITAGGTLAYTDIDDFDILDEVGCAGSAVESVKGTVRINEVQEIKFGTARTVPDTIDPDGGTWNLIFSGGPLGGGNHESSPLSFDASAAAVQTALDSITETDYGTVLKNGQGHYTVTFDGINSSGDIAMMSADSSNLTYEFSITHDTPTPSVNEVHTVELTDGPNSGTFTLTFSKGGAQTTPEFSFAVSAEDVQEELLALSNIDNNGVSVTRLGGGTVTAPYTYIITYIGTMGGENVPEITATEVEPLIILSDTHVSVTNWIMAQKKRLNVPPRQWFEEEVTYMPAPTVKNWYTEIVQIDPLASEPFLVDMLGIWQKPVTWEVSNNPDDGGGAKWYPVLFPLNNPNAYFSFPYNDYGNFGDLDGNNRPKPMRFALRANVKSPYGGTLVAGYQVIPWYEESTVTNRAPIDYNPPWGVSDDDDFRAIIHKPLFQGWFHYFPIHMSTVFQEYPLTKYNY